MEVEESSLGTVWKTFQLMRFILLLFIKKYMLPHPPKKGRECLKEYSNSNL